MALKVDVRNKALAVSELKINSEFVFVDAVRFGLADNTTGNTTYSRMFNTVNIESFIMEFRGLANMGFIVHGSNDKYIWTPLDVYDLLNESVAVTGGFIPGNASLTAYRYSVRNFKNFRYIRVSRDAIGDQVAPSKQVTYFIRTNNSESPKLIIFNGDSMTQGAGSEGQTISMLVNSWMPDYQCINLGIGGQNSTQILSRAGILPVRLTISGNQVLGGDNVAPITSISSNFLSSPADSVARFMGGYLHGLPAVILEDGFDNYSVRGINLNFTQTVPPNSFFIPFQGTNYKNAIHVFWVGRNNLQPSLIDSQLSEAVDYMENMARYVVVGICPMSTETNGTAGKALIDEANALSFIRHGVKFVDPSPPTVEEMARFGHTATADDLAKIAAGVWPLPCYSDGLHFSALGYKIIAWRIYKCLLKQL